MAEYSAETMSQFLNVDMPEFTRLVRDGHIPRAKRKNGIDYFDTVPATQGYIKYLQHKAEARSVSEVADLFGVTVRQIQSLTADGVIKTAGVMGGKSHAREYDLRETCAAIYKHMSAKATGRTATAKEAELRADKLKAEIALKESQGELHKLRTAIAAGKYISVEEVQVDYSKFFVIFKKFASSIPSRVAGIAQAVVDPVIARSIEKDLTNEVNSMLRSFVVAGKQGDEGTEGGEET